MLRETFEQSLDSASARANLALDQLVEERTAELKKALALVESQKQDLEDALRAKDEIQQQLETELGDARLLHELSSMMADEESIDGLYQRLVEAATLVMHSDFGSLQRFDRSKGQLELIAHHGLDDESVEFWKWVYPGRSTTCGKALEIGKRVIVSDMGQCDFIAGSGDFDAFCKAGVQAAQSTPLLTRNGHLVGMITTHWNHCYVPRERDLRLFDIIARQAADLIERNTSAAALRLHAENLVAADRYKDEFLATLAHELRNPLAPIRTGLTLLQIGKPDEGSRILPMMERQLGHMVRLIDDLLDVSRISRGIVTLKRSQVSLSAIIESAIETSRPLINAANHKFTVTVPGNVVWLDVDETRVAQIISNLLNNAAKYTPKSGRIELLAEASATEVVIRIVDSGIGIAAAMLPRIFDLFTQVDRGSERSQGGLGVGLALAKHLAELHHGRIEAASAGENGGSVFTLRLPVFIPTAETPNPVHLPGHQQLEGVVARVLIVDDNADAAESLAQLLHTMGHITHIVRESPTALAIAREFKPDVVFLDIGMPHLNGFDLARMIRSDATLQGIYLATLSGWGKEEDRAQSKRAGIDRHLTKPATFSDVENALMDAFSPR